MRRRSIVTAARKPPLVRGGNLAIVAVLLLLAAQGWCIVQASRALDDDSSSGSCAANATFDSVFMAMVGLPEAKVINRAYFETYRGIFGNPALNAQFQDPLNLAMSNHARATYFWPADTSWSALERELCMSVDQILATLKSAPAIASDYMRINIIPGRTLLAEEFKDGMELQTLQTNPNFTLTLARKEEPGREARWVLRGASAQGTDVTIVRSNIRAGCSVIHFVDAAVLDDGQRRFWLQQKENACSKSKLSPAIIAAIIIPCVVAVGALLAVVLVLRRKKQLHLQRSGQIPVLQSGGADPPSSLAPRQHEQADVPGVCNRDQHVITVNDKEQQAFAKEQQHAAGLGGTPLLGTPPSTPPAAAMLRSISGTASEGSTITGSANADPSEDATLMPVFEASPAVPQAQFAAWLAQCNGHSSSSSSGSSGSGSGGGSRRRAAHFSEQLRQELDAVHGNPNLVHNYTNFQCEVEHGSTAVYFAEGTHNNRNFALKMYSQPAAFLAEREAYKLLGGPHSKYVPRLEMTYPGTLPFPTSVLVFERGQCTLEAFALQRPSYFQQIDIFHQLLSAVQHLHEHGLVHRDMKPSNVVHFPADFLWKLIDLATVARIGQDAKIVYTREYCSPEVARAVVSGSTSMVTDPATDLWGVGIVMYELATGHRFFPREWSADGASRIWAALCGFEPLPTELDMPVLRSVDRGLMRQIRKLLQRDPARRPTPRQLLAERIFQARGNTTTHVSQGSSLSHGSSGTCGASAPLS